MGDPGTAAACKAEFDALTDTEREELADAVKGEMTVALSDAIIRMWHACRLLS